jgi:transposase
LDKHLPQILGDSENGLSPVIRRLVEQLQLRLRRIQAELDEFSAEIERIADHDSRCENLRTIPGVGPLVATALIAAVGDGSNFQRSRDLAAWIGLVPRQYSTGGRAKLLGISKRRFGTWLSDLESRAHRNVVAVGLANKLARIALAVLRSCEPYGAR